MRFLIGGSFPLVEYRPGQSPLFLPLQSVSRHRTIFVDALQSAGLHVQVEFLPELTVQVLCNAMDKLGSQDRFDVVCLNLPCNLSDEVLFEDGYGGSIPIAAEKIKTFFSQQASLLFLTGGPTPAFARSLASLAVANIVLSIDPSTTRPLMGITEIKDFISNLFQKLLEKDGDIKTAVDEAVSATAQTRSDPQFESRCHLYKASSLYPPRPITVTKGSPKIIGWTGIDRLRLDHNVSPHGCAEGLSQPMAEVISAFEKTCTFRSAVITGAPGNGRSTFAGQAALWLLERQRCEQCFWCSCLKSAPEARRVRGERSLLRVLGAMMLAGIAARKLADLKIDAVLQSLRGKRIVLVLDDWDQLSERSRTQIAKFLVQLPQQVRVIITFASASLTKDMGELEVAHSVGGAVCVMMNGLTLSEAERMMFRRIHKCLCDDPFSEPVATFLTGTYLTGYSIQLGDLNEEERQSLKNITQQLDANPLAICMMSRCAKDEKGSNIPFLIKSSFPLPPVGADGSIWAPFCFIHHILNLNERAILLAVARCACDVFVEHLSYSMGFEVSNNVRHDLHPRLIEACLLHVSAGGLVSMSPAIKNCVQLAITAKLTPEDEEMEIEYPMKEILSTSVSHSKYIDQILSMCSALNGAWIELCAVRNLQQKYRIRLTSVSQQDAKDIQFIIDSLVVAFKAWFWDWERGSIPSPGSYEEGRDIYSEEPVRPCPPSLKEIFSKSCNTGDIVGDRFLRADLAEKLASITQSLGEYEHSKELFRISIDSRKQRLYG